MNSAVIPMAEIVPVRSVIQPKPKDPPILAGYVIDKAYVTSCGDKYALIAIASHAA